MKKIIFTLIGRLASLVFFIMIIAFMHVCSSEPNVSKIAVAFSWIVEAICFAFVWWIAYLISTANYKITK